MKNSVQRPEACQEAQKDEDLLAKKNVRFFNPFLPIGEISERGIAIRVVVRPSVRGQKIVGADF